MRSILGSHDSSGGDKKEGKEKKKKKQQAVGNNVLQSTSVLLPSISNKAAWCDAMRDETTAGTRAHQSQGDKSSASQGSVVVQYYCHTPLRELPNPVRVKLTENLGDLTSTYNTVIMLTKMSRHKRTIHFLHLRMSIIYNN